MARQKNIHLTREEQDIVDNFYQRHKVRLVKLCYESILDLSTGKTFSNKSILWPLTDKQNPDVSFIRVIVKFSGIMSYGRIYFVGNHTVILILDHPHYSARGISAQLEQDLQEEFASKPSDEKVSVSS